MDDRGRKGEGRSVLKFFLSSVASVLRPPSSHRGQPGVEVLDEVVGVFEPGGEAHQTVADAEFGAGCGREPLVRGSGGVRDQALGVAEIVAYLGELARILEAECGRLAAFDIVGDQRRTRPQLAVCYCGLPVRGP